VSWIPVVGDQVWIRFLDGEVDKPIWEWGVQNTPQAKTFGLLPIHAYDKCGNPLRRSAFSRYHHWWELLPTGHDMWTKSGYHFEIYDEQIPGKPSGRLTWTTALGFLHSLDDSNETLTTLVSHIERTCKTETTQAAKSVEYTSPNIGVNFGTIELGGSYRAFRIDATRRTLRGLHVSLNMLGVDVITSVLLNCTGFEVTNGGLSFDANNNANTLADIGFGVKGDRVRLGYKATDPVVRLSDLVKALSRVKAVFDAHCHNNSGGPSVGGTPVLPAIYTATGSDRVFAEPRTTISGAVH
jgi:hypothetical protein